MCQSGFKMRLRLHLENELIRNPGEGSTPNSPEEGEHSYKSEKWLLERKQFPSEGKTRQVELSG